MVDGSIQLERIADKDLKKLSDNIVATSLNDKSYIDDFHLASVNRVRDDFAENNDMERLKVIDCFVVELTNSFKEPSEWDEIIQEYGSVGGSSLYSLNMKLQGVMDFLVANNVKFTHENSDIRNGDDWHKQDLVQSYLQYLLTSDTCHLFFQPALMKYVYHCCDKQDWAEVERVYRIVNDKVDLISPILATAFAKGLKHSSNDVLDDMLGLVATAKLFDDAATKHRHLTHQNLAVQNDLVQYALRKDHLEVALSYINSLVQRGTTTKSIRLETFNQILEKFSFSWDAKLWKRNRQVVEVLLNVLSQRQYFLANETYAEAAVKWFKAIENESWAVKKINIQDIRRCECPVTGVSLIPSELSDEEHYLLKSFVLITIMKKLYTKVHMETLAQKGKHLPNEESIHQFFEFILKNGPFNVVVDGLNVVLHNIRQGLAGKERYDPGFYRLARVLEILQQGSTKEINILVTLKRHMIPVVDHYKHLFRNHNVQFYYVPNDMHDDSLIFYAAICSGPNCYFVSRDFFRDYKALITDNLGHDAAKLFYKYQQSRQITVLEKGRRKDDVYLGRNNIVESRIQYNEGVWHIPRPDGKYVDDPNKLHANKFNFDSRIWLVVYDQNKHQVRKQANMKQWYG